jgi:hypothetical protein
MDALRLVALDEDDLKIVSAHVQDALTRVGDLAYDAAARRFILPINRYAWEVKSTFFRPRRERRNSVLHFDRVLGVKTAAIARDKPQEVLSLLAVRFQPGEAPAGTIELVFSGGGTVRLEAECIEARLTDLGGAWQASSRPFHTT